MKKVLSLVVLLMFGSSVSAQGQIDGKKNPEKIPDSLAYFMYFSDVGHALDNETKDPVALKLLLQGSGLNDVDQYILKQVIITHSINQRVLRDKINSDVMTGTATKDSFIAYHNARKKCTMDAVNSVLAQVSPEDAVAFRKFTQAFKANLSMDEGVETQWKN